MEEELFGPSDSKPAVIPSINSFPLPTSSSSSSMMTAHSFAAPAYDPFLTQPPQPLYPQPVITTTPTPFDEVYPAVPVVTSPYTTIPPTANPPPYAAAASMEDDFDAFFESLGKSGDQLK